VTGQPARVVYRSIRYEATRVTGDAAILPGGAGAGEPTVRRSWRKKMAAARSRGRMASACSGVRVPERNAAMMVGSRVKGQRRVLVSYDR